jgi:hypothetical protein
LDQNCFNCVNCWGFNDLLLQLPIAPEVFQLLQLLKLQLRQLLQCRLLQL